MNIKWSQNVTLNTTNNPTPTDVLDSISIWLCHMFHFSSPWLLSLCEEIISISYALLYMCSTSLSLSLSGPYGTVRGFRRGRGYLISAPFRYLMSGCLVAVVVVVVVVVGAVTDRSRSADERTRVLYDRTPFVSFLFFFVKREKTARQQYKLLTVRLYSVIRHQVCIRLTTQWKSI